MRGIGLIRLRIGIMGESLWMRHWTSGFHKPWSYLISYLRVRILALYLFYTRNRTGVIFRSISSEYDVVNQMTMSKYCNYSKCAILMTIIISTFVRGWLLKLSNCFKIVCCNQISVVSCLFKRQNLFKCDITSNCLKWPSQIVISTV